MARVSIKGALIGGILDIVLSMILGIPLGVYAAATGNLGHVPPDQLSKALTAFIHSSPVLYGIQLLIGVACTTLGGYVAARIAKRDEVLNGLASSLVCVTVGVISLVAGIQQDTVATEALLFMLTLAAGMFGGYIRSRGRRTVPDSQPTNV